MVSTTSPIDIHPVYCGFTPCASSHFATGSANAASPTMPFRIAIDVMPICTVDRKRVGSWLSSSARAAPWSPSSASFCSRPLREATSAISDIAKAPFTRIRKKRSAISMRTQLSHCAPPLPRNEFLGEEPHHAEQRLLLLRNPLHLRDEPDHEEAGDDPEEERHLDVALRVVPVLDQRNDDHRPQEEREDRKEDARPPRPHQHVDEQHEREQACQAEQYHAHSSRSFS